MQMADGLISSTLVANVAMEVLWAAMFWDGVGCCAVCRFSFFLKNRQKNSLRMSRDNIYSSPEFLRGLG